MHLSFRRATTAHPSCGHRQAVLFPARYTPESRAPPPHDQQEDASSSPSSFSSSAALRRAAVPLSTLDRADKSLADYCASKPAGSKSREACLEVLRYYRDKRLAAQGECLVDLERDSQQLPQPSSSSACASLAQLERLVYETSYSGGDTAKHLVQVLAAQRAVEMHHQQQGATATAQDDESAKTEALRRRALRLFALADSDGNGRLDREEFLAAVRLMDAELSDAELGAVFSALDAHVSLTVEQFVDAVTGESFLAAALADASVDDVSGSEAEVAGGGGDAEAAWRAARGGRAFLRAHVRRQPTPAAIGDGAASAGAASPSCDADALRRVRHSRPTWWSDSPGCVETV